MKTRRRDPKAAGHEVFSSRAQGCPVGDPARPGCGGVRPTDGVEHHPARLVCRIARVFLAYIGGLLEYGDVDHQLIGGTDSNRALPVTIPTVSRAICDHRIPANWRVRFEEFVDLSLRL